MPQSCPSQLLSFCAALLVDASVIFSISPILSAASICLELIKFFVFHLFKILFHISKIVITSLCKQILGGSDGKESACSAGDLGSIPGSRRSPGEGKGYPLQYSCLENRRDRGAWWATAHGVAKSWTPLKWLITPTDTHFHFYSVCLFQISYSLFQCYLYIFITLRLSNIILNLFTNCPIIFIFFSVCSSKHWIYWSARLGFLSYVLELAFSCWSWNQISGVCYFSFLSLCSHPSLVRPLRSPLSSRPDSPVHN